MKARVIALLLVIMLGLLGLVWLHTQVLPYQGWAIYGERWMLRATGWATLLHAWPVGLAGLLSGAWVGLVVGGWLGHQATRWDLTDQYQAAQQAQDRAHASEQLAREAQARAFQAQYAATLAEAQAKQAQARAEAHIAEITTQAQATIAAAEARRRNAAGAAERRRRKLERLQSGTPRA